jgi:hypothetical protein
MKRGAVLLLVVGLAIFASWLQRESTRGTFDSVQGAFLSWLAANSPATKRLPPLTLVLYDDEASEMAGTERMAMLDGALFVRAVSRLGASGAGVEGLTGDPTRMIEAAGRMPVFGGYDPSAAPGSGWTPLKGEPGTDWLEMSGLAGRPARFSRGFLAAPVGNGGGAKTIRVAARNAGQAVPSFLALAWAAAQGWRWSEVVADPSGLRGPSGQLTLDSTGAVQFLPAATAPRVMTMNELFVLAEKFEREGGTSPLSGHIVVLGPATSEVTRVAGEGAKPLTPVEQWAAAWEAVRTNRLFHSPGWWYPAVVVAVASLLALGSARRSNAGALLAGFFALLVFAMLGLVAFSSARVALPAALTLLTLAAGLMVGRAGFKSGWFGL